MRYKILICPKQSLQYVLLTPESKTSKIFISDIRVLFFLLGYVDAGEEKANAESTYAE